MTRPIRRLALTIGLAGLGFVALGQPASAFFGSFAASCRDIRVYGDDYMTAWCRRIDGTWNFSQISNCGGYGVHNQNGWLRCGT